MGLTLDTTVVVKELADSGNAVKSGVKLGDQLQQVCVVALAPPQATPTFSVLVQNWEWPGAPNCSLLRFRCNGYTYLLTCR